MDGAAEFAQRMQQAGRCRQQRIAEQQQGNAEPDRAYA